MIRALIYGIIGIFVITFVRMVMGIVMKEMGNLMKEETASQPSPHRPAGQKGPTSGGELKACQTCGTYVLAAKAVTSGPDTFCSAECQKKAARASA